MWWAGVAGVAAPGLPYFSKNPYLWRRPESLALVRGDRFMNLPVGR